MSKLWMRTIATTVTTIALTATAATAFADPYTVQPGDTLSGIAATHGTTWPRLYAANRDVVGADPDLIYPNQVLVIGSTTTSRAAETRATPSAAADVVLPVADYRLTARFGQAGSRWASTHTGLDFAAPTGTAVRAVHDGSVTSAGWAGAYGRRVELDHGDGTTSSYSHLSGYAATGRVAAGTVVGYVGATGNVTGPHLHLEISVGGSLVDPDSWLTRNGVTP